MAVLKTIANKLYGAYAVTVMVPCFVVGGAILLLTPGQTNRRLVARVALRITFFMAGMPVRVRGLENVPDGPCVAIANHRSYVDGLAVVAALPAHFSPVIKVGPSRIPIIGLVLRCIGASFVERMPPARAAVDTRHLLQSLQGGESLCMFPEGTFSGDGGLLPFRMGAFFLATHAGVPVLPVVIRGAGQALSEDSILPSMARLEVALLAPIAAPAGDHDAAQRLRARAEDALWHGLVPPAVAGPASDQSPGYQYYCRVFADRSPPFAYLDLDLLEDNIRAILAHSGGKALRVDAHVLRCPGIIRRVLRSHTRFHGVRCATVEEAVLLGRDYAVEDLLVAYPTTRTTPVEQAIRQLGEGRITFTADNLGHLRCLERAAQAAGVQLPVCVWRWICPVTGRVGAPRCGEERS